MHSMNYGNHHAGNRENHSEKRQGKLTAVKDPKRLNMRGDVYGTNANGQITSFKFSGTEISFSFSYDEKNELSAISSSAAWTWTKTKTEDFSGWVIRNYFDLWQVSDEDAGSVFVDQTGIHATGKRADMMALPESARA